MSHLRLWIPAFSMLLMSLISYVDRHTLAILAPTILKDCGLTAEQYGLIISAFSITYMLGNPIWGRWLDRLGTRRGMTAAVSLWTVASASHAFIGSFWGFAGARAILGFGEGATFPGALRTVVETLPLHLRARGTALAYSGGSLGAVVTPLIVTPIFQMFGWRAAFWFTGFIGMAWLAWWLVLSRRLLRVVEPTPAVAPADLSFRDPRLWSFMFSYAMGGLPLAFVLYHTALYFSRALGKSQVEIGAVLWIPPLGWEAGYFVWGWLADRFRHRWSDPVGIYRALTWLALVLILPLAWTPYAGSFPAIMALLFLAMFVAGGNVITAIGFATGTFGSGSAGFIAGLGAGSWSAFVALTMPWFGRMIDQQRYGDAFLAATIGPILGFSLFLWINRRKA